MNRSSIYILLFFLVFSCTIYSQGNSPSETFTFTETITSKFLNESRRFTIQLPRTYHTATATKYPVLYVLDAQTLQKHTAFIHDYLSEKGHIPESIIVSIPHTGKRDRDYKTFYRDSDKINGGANHFLDFIEKEVIAFVDSTYRSSNYRLLSGHSNSGLFVIHTLLKKPALFNARFAFSPSSHHIPKQRELLIQFLKENQNLNNYFYMNVGGSEFYKMTDAFNEIKQIFQEYAETGLRYDFDFHDADGHQSSPFIGQHMAFKRLYAPFRLTLADYRDKSHEEIIRHFDKASVEFGYEIVPSESELQSIGRYFITNEATVPILQKLRALAKQYHAESSILSNNLVFAENWLRNGTGKKMAFYSLMKPNESLLNSMGYQALEGKQQEKARYLFKLATLLYPNSTNVWDSLGESYELAGDNKRALKMYKKAYDLAVKMKQEEAFYLERIERTELKLKNQ